MGLRKLFGRKSKDDSKLTPATTAGTYSSHQTSGHPTASSAVSPQAQQRNNFVADPTGPYHDRNATEYATGRSESISNQQALTADTAVSGGSASRWSKLNPMQSSSTSQQPPSVDEAPPEFRLHITKTLWPTYNIGDATTLDASGQLHLDFTNSLISQWGHGVDAGNRFGQPLFQVENKNGWSAEDLPPYLFDLVTAKLVRSADVAPAIYCCISHVWGPVRDIDGNSYGIPWKIPIRSQMKLNKILEAARVVTGERFIWMDVLCMDQRRRDETEIARMQAYFANASGCLVWLDDAFEDGTWHETLSAIKEINKFFGTDAHGVPTMSVADFMQKGMGGQQMNEVEAFKWIKEMVRIEKAPWFKRVWTLQEGIIPENIFFVTPERYMTGGSNIFQIISMCEMVGKLLIDTGSTAGFACIHELQKSEIFKMIKLRQAYRKRAISYWHLAQAVRSRDCKYEQDRVFGICGLVHGTIPVINYDRSIQGLYADLYQSYVDDGDFSALMFVGGQTLTPDKDISMGFIRPDVPAESETHQLILSPGGLRMDGIGCDPVTRVHCFLGWGPLEPWQKKFPQFLDVGMEAHLDFARAFDMEIERMEGGLCPAAFASYGCMTGMGTSDLIKMFPQAFQEMYYKNEPKGFLGWTRASMLMQDRYDSAICILWTQSSEPQLAVVTEPVEGSVIVVTPSSYMQTAGPGALICSVRPDGTLRKIGIAIGRCVKASRTGDFLMTV